MEKVDEKMGGALVVHVSKNGEGSLLWGHSTESMSIGYMKTSDKRPKVCLTICAFLDLCILTVLQGVISEFPSSSGIGSTINVGGVDFVL